LIFTSGDRNQQQPKRSNQMEQLELTEAETKARLKQHYLTLGMSEADATRQAGLGADVNEAEWLTITDKF
jgi:hypothetical protein